LERTNKFYQPFYECAELLKEFTNKSNPLFFLHNQGNWGDGVIRFASFQFLNYFKIDFIELNSINEIIDHRNLYSEKTIIYQGGGALCKFWDHSNIIIELSTIFKYVIVFPSTFQIHLSLSNVIFFRRDLFESKEYIPDSIFCHDMAFFLNPGNIETGDGIGYFFRTDRESLRLLSINSKNQDISLLGSHNSTPDGFIELISKNKIIFTDRLHVAIIGSLMNKIVHFYSGAYFKNKAVYLSSMKYNFPKTIFHELIT
jgi:exopolysaccharide biosynthesis predicted pyruvyltransferase EpsI